MKTFSGCLNNEQGSVLVVALLFLVLLSLVGLSGNRTSSVELQVVGNEKTHQIAFYTAEAARGYVAMRPALYGTDNIMLTEKLYFPDNDNAAQKYSLGTSNSFNGNVEYMGPYNVPRGSGFDVGQFKAHRYRMACNGYATANAESEIETGFYRVGF